MGQLKIYLFKFNLKHYLGLKRKSRAKERGAILVISIILLLIMTLIGVATFEGSVTESKVESNVSNIMQANFANQVAMQAAINLINSWTQSPNTCNSTSSCSSCSGCIWQQGALHPSPNWPQSTTITANSVSVTPADTWWSTAGNSTTLSGVPNVAKQPQYLIEQWGCDQGLQARYFRVISRSVGITEPPVVTNYAVVGTIGLPPYAPMGTVYDNSNAPCHIGYYSASKVFTPTMNGNITVVWIGSDSWTSGFTATISLSSASGGTVTYNACFTPPEASTTSSPCSGTLSSGDYYGPACNMGSYILPQPYPVKTANNVTLNISGASSTIHVLTSSSCTQTNARITIQGQPTTSFCP